MSSDALSLLNSMQEEYQEKYPSRKVFHGADGAVATGTIQCMQQTVDGWKELMKRADHFEKGLGKSITPHTVTNESNVEHAFGTKKSGQGHLLSLEEYVQAKRSTRVNFQLKMCSLPFTQNVKGKLRDKGYQDIQQASKLDLTLPQLKEVIQADNRTFTNAAPVDVVSEQDKINLKKVYLLAKTVPRNGMRSRWRETGNYQPSFLSKDTSGKLSKGDMVFFSDAENSLQFLIVQKDFEMSDISKRLPVHLALDKKKKLNVDLSKLVYVDGFILTVPGSLFSVSYGQVMFDHAVDDLLASARSGAGNISDEDIPLLHENPDLPIARFCEEQPGPSRFRHTNDDLLEGSSSDESEPTRNRRRTKRKKNSSSDDDDLDFTKQKKKRRIELSSDEEIGSSAHKLKEKGKKPAKTKVRVRQTLLMYST